MGDRIQRDNNREEHVNAMWSADKDERRLANSRHASSGACKALAAKSAYSRPGVAERHINREATAERWSGKDVNRFLAKVMQLRSNLPLLALKRSTDLAAYARLPLGSRFPRDAVIVTVRRALGRTVADVAAVDQIADFPLPVPRALEQASRWCGEMGLARIQVVLEDERLWRADWGELRGPAST